MSFARLDTGSTVSDAHARHILNGLRARTLSEPEWTHGAHLTAAVVLLNEVGLARASVQMPEMIRRYNESLGGINSDTAGYHHTITLFYLQLIDKFCTHYSAHSIGEQATTLLSSPLSDRTFPLRYYSKELLFSIKARRNWAEPDLTQSTFAEIVSINSIDNQSGQN